MIELLSQVWRLRCLGREMEVTSLASGALLVDDGAAWPPCESRVGSSTDRRHVFAWVRFTRRAVHLWQAGRVCWSLIDKLLLERSEVWSVKVHVREASHSQPRVSKCRYGWRFNTLHLMSTCTYQVLFFCPGKSTLCCGKDENGQAALHLACLTSDGVTFAPLHPKT